MPHSGSFISIGVIAWNEERAIRTLLKSLFEQTLLAELETRGLRCEIICVANGCTDRTVEVAQEVFAAQSKAHPHAAAFKGKALNLVQRGKINAWNEFVHSLSAREARYLFLMDADIILRNPRTLWSMVQTLEMNAEARVAVDVPRKELELKASRTFRERMSLKMSRLTRSAPGQLCAQLYCIRSETARNIYLPKDLSACDDGFIKALVCTDFLAHSVWPMRIQVARDASHTFEPYTTLKTVFKNQKRQAIGQTIVHLLIDDYLKRMPAWERSKLADTLRRKERENPDWLKRLIHEHLRRKRYFWRLYPGAISQRFQRMKKLRWLDRISALPAVLAGTAISLAATFAAFRFLKSGSTSYWPRAERNPLEPIELSTHVSPLARLKIH